MFKNFMDNCFLPKLDEIFDLFGHRPQHLLRDRVETFLNDAIAAAYNFGFRYAAVLAKHKGIEWEVSEDACSECKRLARTMRPIKRLVFDELVPPHYECIIGQKSIKE